MTNDIHLLAALHHVTDTARDTVTDALMMAGARLTFTAEGARLELHGMGYGVFTLGQPCPRFASVPLLFHGPNLRRPILWRTVPLSALAWFEAQVA